MADPLSDAQKAWDRGDYATAFRLIKPLAEKGDITAEDWLADIYAEGSGASKDYKLAEHWYLLAATHGDARAPFELGYFFYNGFGVAADMTTAVKWNFVSALRGYGPAQHWISVMYAQGTGLPKHPVQSRMWQILADHNGGDTPHRTIFLGELKLTAAQEQIASFMAQKCLTTHYKKCGGPSEYSDAMEQGLRAIVQGMSGQLTTGDVRIKLIQEGGTYVVPVIVNDAIKLGFVLDSGASDVSIPVDVFSTLVRAGTISQSDVTGSRTYEMADGTKTSTPTFTIKSLKIGSAIVTNVSGAVAPAQGALLLGQSFLSHFSSWSIDNSTHELVLRSAH